MVAPMTVHELTVHDRIVALLADTPYDRVEHPPTFTADEAAAARGLPVEWGGKSLVMKVGADFALFVLSGARKLAGRRIQRHFKASRLRFATREELFDLTSLEPGCVPPFGRPIFDLPLYLDQASADQDRIAFNPGDHGVSMMMQTADYLAVARPVEIFSFSR